MYNSQDIRSRKRPYNGSRPSILTEYSSSSNAGNEIVTSISKYNTYQSDFEQENQVRPTIKPDSGYRNSSYSTIKEDIGESTPDTLTKPVKMIVQKKSAPSSSTESFDPNGMIKILLILIVVVVAVILFYLYIKKVEKNRAQSYAEQVQIIETEYDTMMAEL